MTDRQKAAKSAKIRAYQAAMRATGHVECAIWLDAGLIDAAKAHARARGITLRALIVEVLSRAVTKSA